MSSSKRLFIGIELPPESKALLGKLDPHIPGLRWLPPGQLHLTLSFLGDVNASKHDTLTAALSGVHVAPFFLPLEGVGTFNAHGRPSIVWVGVGKGHPHLFALHKRIQDAVLRAGLEPDLKPFHPHVTVGRAKGLSMQKLQPFLRSHRESEIDLFQVTEFLLFSSVLDAEGATHRIEFRVALEDSGR